MLTMAKAGDRKKEEEEKENKMKRKRRVKNCFSKLFRKQVTSFFNFLFLFQIY